MIRIGIGFDPRQVAETGVFRGAHLYAEEHSELELLPFPVGDFARSLAGDEWHLDGWLAPAPELVRRVPEMLLPKCCGWFASARTHSVSGVNLDNVLAGQLAARHLLTRGCRRLVYFHNLQGPNDADRFRGFVKAIPEDAEFLEYREGPRTQRAGWSTESQVEDLGELLASSKPPLGLYAYDDVHGLRALEACRVAGLCVPRDVAIITTSMNRAFCRYSKVPLSAVENSAPRQGYEATKLLHERLSGLTLDTFRMCAPGGIIARESTRIRHSDDPLVQRAMRWLSGKEMESWNVNSLCKDLNCSRMTLLRRFRATLDESPKEVMLRMQLEAARQQVSDTEKSLSEIALDCGFSDSAHFSRSYRNFFGEPPYATRNG